jgi:hypothetical protein
MGITQTLGCDVQANKHPERHTVLEREYGYLTMMFMLKRKKRREKRGKRGGERKEFRIF